MGTTTPVELPISGEGLVVECVDGVERYYPDGTFVGRITDRETFEWAHDLWSVCQVVTEPPSYQGNWVLVTTTTGDSAVCWRFDLLPGIIGCRLLKFDDETGEFFLGQAYSSLRMKCFRVLKMKRSVARGNSCFLF